MHKFVCGCLLAFGLSTASAAINAYVVRITAIIAMSEFGNGDVVIQYSSPVGGCLNGFWLSPSQPGFKQMYATVLSAAATGKTVALYSETAQLWSGSTGQYCKLSAIQVDW